MKKALIAFMAAGLLASCNEGTNTQQAKSDNTVDSLIGVINQKDNELNDILSTFNDIQEGFRQINEAEGRVNIERGKGEKSAKDDIMESISFIRRTMEVNRERIAKLKQQLKTSSFNTDKLQQTIEGLSNELEQKSEQIKQLQSELEAKNIHIAEQDKQITDLNTNVNALTTENADKARTVERQDKQLNTAWYVFGTKKELKEQRILQSGDVLKSSNFNLREFGKRVALNMPVQGSAADIMKLAMVRVHDRLKREGLCARLLMQVHDELIVECPVKGAEQVKKIVTAEMENVVQLKVPLLAEAKSGASWYEAK